MQSVIQISSSWNQTFYPFWGAEKAFLLIELKGNGSGQVERAPMNLSLVLDRSGSMTGSPLEYSKKACQFVVDQMGSQDLLSMRDHRFYLIGYCHKACDIRTFRISRFRQVDIMPQSFSKDHFNLNTYLKHT